MREMEYKRKVDKKLIPTCNIMVEPIIIETQRFEDFRGWLSVPVDRSLNFHVVQINQGLTRCCISSLE